MTKRDSDGSGDGPRGGSGRDPVLAQYEAYPYPPRDPADEKKRLVIGSPSHLREIDHYVFGGRRDPRTPLNVLVAGGGTGDGAIMLAQQLADEARALGTDPGQVTHVDISGPSQAIAKARARVRELGNIRFVEGSLLEIGALAPGPYDYVDCCGVLHHLPDPEAGLAALRAVLADGGGMGLMLYAPLGRTGVYPVQRALRALADEAESPADKVALARSLLDNLPETNWLRRNSLVADHLQAGESGIYDLLLHARDRSYSVPEVAVFAASAGLAVTAFIEPVRYDPAVYLTTEELLKRARALSWLEACALAENLCGTMKTHVFYAVPEARAAGAVARPGAQQAVPVLREGDPVSLAGGFAKAGRIKIDLDGVSARFDLPEGAAAIVGLIDGRRSLGEIQRVLGLDWFAFKARFDRLYAVLNPLNMLLVRRV